MKEDAKKKPLEKKSKIIEEVKTEVVDEKELLKKAEEKEKVKKIEAKEVKKVKKTEKKIEKIKEEKIAKVTRVKKHGKKYKEIKNKIEVDKIYEINEAISLIKELPKRSFDATVELHMRLDKKVENLRGVVNLPAGAPKSKVVVEVNDKNVEDIVEKVKAGKIKFDIMIATPSVMPKLTVLAKILGPKGQMPNPKNGTISENTKETAEDFKGGKVEFKADKGNNIHFAVAKISYTEEKIKENIDAVVSAVPIGKVITAHLNLTMGPSIKIKVGK